MKELRGFDFRTLLSLKIEVQQCTVAVSSAIEAASPLLHLLTYSRVVRTSPKQGGITTPAEKMNLCDEEHDVLIYCTIFERHLGVERLSSRALLPQPSRYPITNIESFG